MRRVEGSVGEIDAARGLRVVVEFAHGDDQAGGGARQGAVAGAERAGEHLLERADRHAGGRQRRGDGLGRDDARRAAGRLARQALRSG